MSSWLISILAGAVVAAILLVAAKLTSGNGKSVRQRARHLRETRGWGRDIPTRAPSITRREDKLGDTLVQRLIPRPDLLRSRLEATGLAINIGQYGAASAGVFLSAAVVLLVAGSGVAVSLFLAIAAGAFLPHAVVGAIAAKRSNRFLKILPDAIGLMVRGLRAGLPVTETITVVALEAADPVGEEFRDVTEQVRLGRPLEEAMWAMAKRLNLPEFNFLVISLSVQRETGGNLAETLENLNQILRSRSQMRLKIKAMSSEATASALIIGSLPFVMAGLMMLFSPDYLSVLFTDPLGQMMTGGALASLFMGVLIMRKMVRFEI